MTVCWCLCKSRASTLLKSLLKLKRVPKHPPMGPSHHWGALAPATSPPQPAQDRQPTAGRLLAVVCHGTELLESLGQAEAPPSRVQACTIEVWPEGLLSWGLDLLKATPLASLGQPGARRSGSPKGLEMFGASCCRAANAVPLLQAGREGGEERGDSQSHAPAPCPGCPWVCRSCGAQEKVPVALKRDQPAVQARVGLDQDELEWGCLNLQCPWAGLACPLRPRSSSPDLAPLPC